MSLVSVQRMCEHNKVAVTVSMCEDKTVEMFQFVCAAFLYHSYCDSVSSCSNVIS